MEMENTNTCQACGMPLENPDEVSKFSNGFCVYCQSQETGTVGSYDEIKEGGVKYFMEATGASREEAENLTVSNMATLPYWREKK